ncbi:MAG: thioredoxin-dependent thiol peroxidase [Methanomassiliicoccales archaeon]
MTKLDAGDRAPDFCLPDMDGKETCLEDLLGDYSVIYFYPKDNTAGCTKEARDFTLQLDSFDRLGVPVVGISPDSPESHRKFADKHDLGITLLSDESHRVMERYGVWTKKKMFGKEYMGVVRTTFIVDPEGRIASAWHKVKVAGHVDEVVSKVNELKG